MGKDTCPECKGSGLRDSGGTHPWGDAIMVPCDCSLAKPDCDGCGGGDKWPIDLNYWRCPVCDTEYYDHA